MRLFFSRRLFLNSWTPCHLPKAEKVISPELFGPQKWFTHQNVGSFICYQYMRLFSNSNGMQVPYAPIFDGRLLLGMSLLSKKYSIQFWEVQGPKYTKCVLHINSALEIWHVWRQMWIKDIFASTHSAENYCFNEFEYTFESYVKPWTSMDSKYICFNFLGFKFQSNFLVFIFQNGLDSGFKFQIGGIQDSDQLGLQGHSTVNAGRPHCPTCPTLSHFSALIKYVLLSGPK